MPRPAALYNRRKWQLIGKSQWCRSAMLQLQHTPLPQSTTPGLHPVSIHQMSPPVQGSKHPITAYYSVYRPRKDERVYASRQIDTRQTDIHTNTIIAILHTATGEEKRAFRRTQRSRGTFTLAHVAANASLCFVLTVRKQKRKRLSNWKCPAVAKCGAYGWLVNLQYPRYPEYDLHHFYNLINTSLLRSLHISQIS